MMGKYNFPDGWLMTGNVKLVANKDHCRLVFNKTAVKEIPDDLQILLDIFNKAGLNCYHLTDGGLSFYIRGKIKE